MDTVFTVVNLWLTNNENDAVTTLMCNLIDRVPSYKFVSLSYQILSRLGNESTESRMTSPSSNQKSSRSASNNSNNSSFNALLTKIILKLCSDHPHHTLPQLFALAHERDIGAQVPKLFIIISMLKVTVSFFTV